MSGVVVVVVLGAFLALVAVMPLGRSSSSGARTDDAVVLDRLRAARRRGGLCVAAAAVLLVVGAVVGTTVPGLLGLPLAVAPGLAAVAALLGFAALPPGTARSEGPVSASLTPRTAWSYGSRAAFVLPGAVAVVTLGFLTWAAVVAAPDEQGRGRAFALSAPDVGSSAGPFPGGYYGAPLAVVTVLLAVAAYVALRRVATTPALPRPDQADADRRWRTGSSRLVLHLAGAALLGQLGAIVSFAGLAMHNAAASLSAMGADAGAVGPAGAVLALVGAALVVLAALSAALAVRDVLALSAVRRGHGASAPLATSAS